MYEQPGHGQRKRPEVGSESIVVTPMVTGLLWWCPQRVGRRDLQRSRFGRFWGLLHGSFWLLGARLPLLVWLGCC